MEVQVYILIYVKWESGTGSSFQKMVEFYVMIYILLHKSQCDVSQGGGWVEVSDNHKKNDVSKDKTNFRVILSYQADLSWYSILFGRGC